MAIVAKGISPLTIFGSCLLSWYDVQSLRVSAWIATKVTCFYEALHFLRSLSALFHSYGLLSALNERWDSR